MSQPLPEVQDDYVKHRANWLGRYLDVEREADKKLFNALSEAKVGIDESLTKLVGKEGVGAATRRLQLSLAHKEIRSTLDGLFGNVTGIIKDGQSNAAVAAVDAALKNEPALLTKLFPDDEVRRTYAKSLRASAERNIQATMTRVLATEQPLSQRVWGTQRLSRGMVDRAVNNALARGDSFEQLARDVRDLVDPTTPGGVTYASKRLARTEINNAFHAQSIHDAQEMPWVRQMRWNLSKIHVRQGCVCEEYAQTALFDVEHVPDKPHPHCRCFVTPEPLSDEVFDHALNSGQYDSYLDDFIRTGTPGPRGTTPRVGGPPRKAPPRKAPPRKAPPRPPRKTTATPIPPKKVGDPPRVKPRKKTESERDRQQREWEAARKRRLARQDELRSKPFREWVEQTETPEEVGRLLEEKHSYSREDLDYKVIDFNNWSSSYTSHHAAKEIAVAVDEMLSEQPTAITHIGFTTPEDAGTAIAFVQEHPFFGELKLQWNSNYSRSRFNLGMEVRNHVPLPGEQTNGNKWFVAGTEKQPYRSITTHEWGHVLSKTAKHIGDEGYSNVWVPKVLAKEYGDYAFAEGWTMAGYPDMSRFHDWLRRNTTKYGLQNYGKDDEFVGYNYEEILAEAVADVHTNGVDALPISWKLYEELKAKAQQAYEGGMF